MHLDAEVALGVNKFHKQGQLVVVGFGHAFAQYCGGLLRDVSGQIHAFGLAIGND